MTDPATRRFFPLGGAAVALLAAEALTGLALVFFYRPDAETAYADLVDLEQASGFGFVRALHYWGAHAAVLLVWLLLLRAGLRGAYPRRGWHLRLALAALVTALAATGSVLRWDAETASWLAAFRSPDNDPRLLLVYGLHCAALPLVTAWLVRIRLRRADPAGLGPAAAFAAAGIGLAVVLCALRFETPLGPPPGSGPLPAPATAPWFLAGLQTLGRYFDPWATTLALPLLLLGALAALPGLETALARAGRDPATARRHVRRLFLTLLVIGVLPIAVALILRAPPAAGDAPAFSDVFWGLWMDIGVPARWWLRELPGVLLLALYLLALPRMLPRWPATRGLFAVYREDLGRWRYYAAAVWILALGVVPLKILGRWLWGIGVWVDLPELGIRL